VVRPPPAHSFATLGSLPATQGQRSTIISAKRPMKVFLSHSFQDEAVYSTLRLALHAEGIRLWDRQEISAGESLSVQLQEAIRSCSTCVLIATRRSVESSWCNAELGAFWGSGKRVILFMVDPDLAESVLPPQFKGMVRANSVHELIKGLNRSSSNEESTNDKSYLQLPPRSHDSISSAFSDVIGQIRRNQIQVMNAELIQHSSEVAHQLILSLLSHGVDTELYLQDYETAMQLCGEGIRTRISMRVACYPRIIQEMNFANRFVLKQYQSPASLNGVRLRLNNGDRVLILGWYTYTCDGGHPSLAEQTINGGDLPCIKLHSSDHDYKYFEGMFDKLKGKYSNQRDPVFSHP